MQCTKCWGCFRTVAVAGWRPRFQILRGTTYWNCFHQQKRKGRKILFSHLRESLFTWLTFHWVVPTWILADSNFGLVLQSKGFVPKDGKLTNAFIRATCQADTCTVGQDQVPRGTKVEASKHQNLSFSETHPTYKNFLSGTNHFKQTFMHWDLLNYVLFKVIFQPFHIS